MRRHVVRGLLVALLLGGTLALAACGDDGGDAQAQSGGGGQQQPPAVTVANPLVKELIEWDEFTGRFEAREYIEIRPRVTGYLSSRHFDDGALVSQGQLLYIIDQQPFVAALERARAQVADAEAQLKLARIEADRVRELQNRGSSAVSQANIDERLAQQQVAEAELKAARAQLQQAQIDLAYTEIRAPVTGRTSDTRVDVGNLVNEGQETPLTTIVSLDPIDFVFDMSESEYLAYKREAAKGNMQATRDDDHDPSTGVRVEVRLVDEDGWPHQGELEFVDNQLSMNTATIRVRATLPNTELLLTPGLFGRLRLPGTPLYEALLIPGRAIVTDQARKLAYTVTEDGTVEAKEIKPGPHEFDLRIVREGLDRGDRVIIDGVLRAQPGNKVTPEDGEITIPDSFTG